MNNALDAHTRTRTGRAAVLVAPGQVAVAGVPVAEPGPGQLLLRLEGSGVCGSNLPIWEGRDWFTYPLAAGAPGHEGWGTVEAVGENVEDFVAGDRVASLGAHAFAEFDTVDANAVVRIPPALDNVAFPGEPLGCAMNVFRRSGIEADMRVAIVGVGFLGALLTQLCSRAGAHVVALSHRPYALHTAHQCGAEYAVPLDDRDRAIAHVRELTDGTWCDVVIECTGLQWPLDVAGEITRERGRLVIAGFHQDGPRQVNMFLWNWRGLDVINAHERDPAIYLEGMRAAMTAVQTGVLEPESLFTHRFPLDRTADALNIMRERPDGFMKALVLA
jgi:threonine dehydrogenase-like Zn-dependent dehydrogenase